MSPIDVAALLLFLVPIFDWSATVTIFVVMRFGPHIQALTYWARVLLILAFLATLVAGLAWARITDQPVPPDVSAAILISALFGLSIPHLYLVAKLLTTGFLDEELEP